MWTNEKIVDKTTGIEYFFWAKIFEEPSHFGIVGNGKISKLTIRKVGENRDLCNFDRGWDIKPKKEIKAVYAEILKRFN
jgi:hypothetical protein